MNWSGLSLMVTTCGCSWWWRLAWWWRLVEKQWRVSEKRELWVKEKKMKKEKRQRRTVGERRYLMEQVIQVGPILCLILQKCHWNSILKKWKHIFLFSYFHHSNSKFWVLSDGNKSWKSSQTRIFCGTHVF